VQAHLIGGVPASEVRARQRDFAKFGVAAETLFQSERPGYLAFRSIIAAKSDINTTLESNAALKEAFAGHREALEAWWNVARNDFAQLREGKKLPDVRYELLTTIKSKLIPLGVLDEFQSAAVFVNWWQQIRYDLKTVVSTGWNHTLIPDNYLMAEFFQAEADAIDALEAQIGEAQSELAQAVEFAQEVAAYEPDEDETVTAAGIKKALKQLIDDLEGSPGESARKELKNLKGQEKAITALERRIRDSKAELKTVTDDLYHKLQLKRLGGDEFKAESEQLLRKVESQLAALDDGNKEEKKKITALQKDKAALQARISRTDALVTSVGGQLTEAEAKALILKKLFDVANQELNRYLNTEKRRLIQVVENLWLKYAVSSRALESGRSNTLRTLDGFLSALGYAA
jgi:type I restriction enzyme M protein